MISLTDIQTLSWWKTSILSVLRRIICMGFAWGLLGALVGLNCSARTSGDLVGLAANIVAWMIVMSIVGALLALFGGQPLHCWIGAGLGYLLTLSGLKISGLPPEMQLNMGVLIGAVVAATIWPWARMSLHLASWAWRSLTPASEPT